MHKCVGVHAQLLSHVRLLRPHDCSPPGSFVHGILQARILEQVAISSSRGSSWPRNWTHVFCVSCMGRCILYHCATWQDPCMHISTSKCATLLFSVKILARTSARDRFSMVCLTKSLLVKERCPRTGGPGSTSRSIFKAFIFFAKLLSRRTVTLPETACWNAIFLIPSLILGILIFKSVAICQTSSSFLLWL